MHNFVHLDHLIAVPQGLPRPSSRWPKPDIPNPLMPRNGPSFQPTPAPSAPSGATPPRFSGPNTFAVPEAHGRLFLSFLEVDGLAEVFVNGQRLEPAADGQRMADGLARKRAFFEVEVTAAVRPGENLLAVRVDNRIITDLFRGGVLRPVVLIARP